MELKEGTSVFTPSGEEVGKIKRFVIDPGTKQVTHVVVEKGWLLREDKVVPIKMINSANEERVELDQQVEDYNLLPPFEETHYVEAPEKEDYGQSATHAPPAFWYPPVGYIASPTYGPNIYNWPPVETKLNIPEHTVPLKEGATVVSADDKDVGDLERLFVSSDNDQVTHFVISQGLLLKERKLVPAHWVDRVEESKVHLTVSADLLDRLPAYEERETQRE